MMCSTPASCRRLFAPCGHSRRSNAPGMQTSPCITGRDSDQLMTGFGWISSMRMVCKARTWDNLPTSQRAVQRRLPCMAKSSGGCTCGQWHRPCCSCCTAAAARMCQSLTGSGRSATRWAGGWWTCAQTRHPLAEAPACACRRSTPRPRSVHLPALAAPLQHSLGG